MFLINLNAEIVACMLSFRKSRHKPNHESTSKYGFSPDLGGKYGVVLSMRMQVILDSSFARPGSEREERRVQGLDYRNLCFDRTDLWFQSNDLSIETTFDRTDSIPNQPRDRQTRSNRLER